jgi:hypothetical protein
MKRIASSVAIGLLIGIAFTGWNAKAQNPTLTPYQFGVNNVPHTSCTVVASSTQYCYVSDGPYVSINGAAYVLMLPSSGGITTVTATAPLTATTSGSTVNIVLPSAALKTQIDGLGLTAAASAVQ